MLKTRFIRPSSVRKAIKENCGKQVSKEAIEAIDSAVGRIIYRAIKTAKQFKRLTDKEVYFVTSFLNNE